MLILARGDGEFNPFFIDSWRVSLKLQFCLKLMKWWKMRWESVFKTVFSLFSVLRHSQVYYTIPWNVQVKWEKQLWKLTQGKIREKTKQWTDRLSWKDGKTPRRVNNPRPGLTSSKSGIASTHMRDRSHAVPLQADDLLATPTHKSTKTKFLPKLNSYQGVCTGNSLGRTLSVMGTMLTRRPSFGEITSFL